MEIFLYILIFWLINKIIRHDDDVDNIDKKMLEMMRETEKEVDKISFYKISPWYIRKIERGEEKKLLMSGS